MRKFVFILLYGLLAAAAGALALRFAIGPFRLFFTVNSPVNAGAITAVSFVLLALLAARGPAGTPGTGGPNGWASAGLLAAAAAIAFWPNIVAPFVYDDYTHIVQSSHATWRILAEAFQPEPGGHGLFFRPVGFVWYWLDYQWAGRDALRWHAWCMAAHAANSCLVYALVRRLGMPRAAALIAGLVFALHGSRAEAVAWSDVRFDLLATFLALVSLLAVLAHCRTGRRVYYVPAMTCAALAVYTKESAFCLPLLPLALLPLLPREERRRAIEASVALGALCAVLFAYRWWALGGIGGYVDQTGVRAVWRSRPLHTSEALLYRQWAFLFFPVNWVAPVEWWLRAAAVAFIAMLGICAGWGGASRPRLLAGIAFVLAAVVPVQHILMFTIDFAGARVLYLPLVGLAIFWAALLEGAARRGRRWVAAAVLIGFNVAALQHNLKPWRTTPEAAAAVCRALGREMAHDPRPVWVSGLPDRRQGVYFLSNGFPECVEMNSGQPAGRVHLGDAPPAARQFVWDAQQDGLREVKPAGGR